ncbi:MAG: NfeD family protein [Rhodothermales bacterium]
MKTRISILFALLLLTSSAHGQETSAPVTDRLLFEEPVAGPAFVITVKGIIDGPLAAYIERALKDAADAGAGLVIFHVDTFGGLVDAADEIRKTILNADIPTVALIDKNAASAGALISYAADRIVMVPGASIGAATVVQGTSGEAAPDKYQSYMRGLMRATAEANGRDPSIAEAMVDESIEIEGITVEGEVLTLSTSEAIELRVADAEQASLDELLATYEVNERDVVEHQLTRAEGLLRFFSSPVVQSILMLMMMGGLYFELQSPGVGFPGMIAAVGAAAFFGPHYLLGLVESWEIVLFVLGVVLLLVEIFVIPGFGIAGVTGLAAVLLALGFSLIGNIGFSFPSGQAISSAVLTLASSLVMLIIAMFSLGRMLPRSERFSELILMPTLSTDTGHTSAQTHIEWLGKIGTSITDLRPSGTAEIGDERIDVVTSGEYIEKGSSVEVVSVEGSRVRVRKTRTSA